MTIAFECLRCGCDFELQIPRLIEQPSRLRCPNCENVPEGASARELAEALASLLKAMGRTSKEFRFAVDLETDELPEDLTTFRPARARRSEA